MISLTLLDFVRRLLGVWQRLLGEIEIEKEKEKGLVLGLGLVSDYEQENGFGFDSEDFHLIGIRNQLQKQNQHQSLEVLVYGL